MDTPLRMEQQQVEEQCVFPTAVSEQLLGEARRRSVLNQLFGSSNILLPRGPGLQADLTIKSKALEHFSNGEEAMRQLQYEKAVKCYSKAIALQPKQTQLYVSQAKAYLQLCEFQSAVACYKQASLLEPGAFHDRLASTHHQQGQWLYDMGKFLEALESFSKAAELEPGCRSHQMRSFECLKVLGQYKDCLKMVTNWIQLDPPTAGLYTLRAQLYHQQSQMAQCYHDVRSALELDPACQEASALLGQLEEGSERARQEAVNKALTGALTAALFKINVALDYCPENAHHYLFRGILYRRLKDFTASIEDLVLAVEVSEKQAGNQGQVDEVTQQEVKARDSQQEVKARGTQQEVQARGTQQEVQARGTQQEVKARGTQQEVQARGTQQEVKARDTQQEVQARGTQQEVKARGTQQEVKARGTQQEMKARYTRQEVKARGTQQEMKARYTQQEVKARGTQQEVKARGTQQEVKASYTRQEVKAIQEDAQVQLVLTYNDFAVHCFSRGLYPEATLLLNKAIQEQKEESGLYMNRGDCFFQQREWDFALADYQQAEEMSPNDPAIWARLALIHHTQGTHIFLKGMYQEAAYRFSLAIKYNPGAVQYYENRAKAFHRVLDVEGTKQDVISTLILDPTNEEVVPLLLHVFPCCSVCDVLSSEMGQAVKARLMDSIQSHKRSTDEQRLCIGLERLALRHVEADGQSDSQSEGPSEMEEELKPSQQEMQEMRESPLPVPDYTIGQLLSGLTTYNAKWGYSQ